MDQHSADSAVHTRSEPSILIEKRLPIYTVSEANISCHWTKKKKLHDLQKKWIWLWFKQDKPNIPLPCVIRLIRVGKRLDSDNLQSSFKWIRDTIAGQIFPDKRIGYADDDPRIKWEYDQVPAAKAEEVIIQIFRKVLD